MSEEIIKIIKIKENINKSKISNEIKENMIQKLQELEININMMQEIENDFIKSYITQDTYITRKKILLTERIKLKDTINNHISNTIKEKLVEKDDKGLLQKLKTSIDNNINWISILLDITQILLSI